MRPIIPGFHPDPSVCRVGDTFYLVNSSFEYAPGVPVHTSADLRSWTRIGHVLDRPSQLDVSKAGPSGGIFAPTLRHHDGRFWMITTNWSDEGGQLLVWATSAHGPWSEPVRIPSAVGIDPDLAWDDDGTCLMTYAGFGPNGGEGIVQSPIDPLTGEVLAERIRLWGGTGGKFPEGPHLYRVGDWWYLLIAEGGTERGHAVTIARSRSPRGPFEPGPANPILTHRGTDHPVQSTGHADLVQRADGTWAIVYHGVRARGSSPEWHVLGRETFASEVVWRDGWPVLAGSLEPGTPDAGAPAWVGASRFPDGADHRRGLDGPGFSGIRQEHFYTTTRADLLVEGVGGLSIRIDPRHALDLEYGSGTVRAVWAIGDIRHELGSRPATGDVVLEIRTRPSQGHEFSTARGPDRVIAGVVDSDGFHQLGEIDGRYLSTEVAGGMTGRMIGVFASAGRVDSRSFDYTGTDSAD